MYVLEDESLNDFLKIILYIFSSEICSIQEGIFLKYEYIFRESYIGMNDMQGYIKNRIYHIYHSVLTIASDSLFSVVLLVFFPD